MDTERISEKLKILRGNRTQSEVAAACGITPTAYANYENGIRIPKDIHKVALAKFFGVSVEYIFFT